MRHLDIPKRFHYGSIMPEYTLKNIPADIYQHAQAAAENNLRSLNQEIIYRLRRSFDAEDARATALHAKWVMEALSSGPARVAASSAAASHRAKASPHAPPPCDR